MVHQAATSLGQVRTELRAMLKSEVAIDPLAPPAPGSFRNFISRTISVLDVQGAGIALRKGASRSSDVHLLRLQRGAVQLVHADGCVSLDAGQFVAFRGSQAIQFRHDQPIDLLAVFVPERAVERWLPDWQAAEFVTVGNHQAEGRLGFDVARDLLSSGHQLQDRASADLVGETVTRLMARSLAFTALSDAAAPADLAEACRRKVRQYCRQHLGSPGLSVEAVARANGLSRASLHRLFQREPHTLMEWVQLERLEACRRLLDVPNPRTTLTEIALAHGFKSPAHFSAAFRQRYGVPPREYRALAGAAGRRKKRGA